jgi:hypothetical protein
VLITWFSFGAASQDGVQIRWLLYCFASEFPVFVSPAHDAPLCTAATASVCKQQANAHTVSLGKQFQMSEMSVVPSSGRPRRLMWTSWP